MIDLCDPSDPSKLHPLCVGKLLAFMCFPHDPNERETFLGRMQRDAQTGMPRRRPMSEAEFQASFDRHHNRGVQAGHVILSMVQMADLGLRSSLNKALKMNHKLQPKIDFTASRKVEDWDNYAPRSRKKLFPIIRYFTPVLHLWTAHVHLEEARLNPSETEVFRYRHKTWLDGQPEGLARFVASAEFFSPRISALPTGKGENTIARQHAKTRLMVKVPPQFRIACDLAALPIPEEFRSIFNTDHSKSD